ncbi:o-succinylbenzoate--CoA ligase [Enterobacter sp. MF024]|uniref:o-succinylbenzoate--CoA ligase n=1 Tax=Enterobacter sp. MF024 TaxID=2555644 RepID=UPI001106AA8B|nr:o-succinylbenzoate--CoA ligase [Enterobacter sp. MF024]TLU68385.1 o-succinylbenzoate--CoA ligase [Enterobacter sp. MF024]
MTFSDWPWRHWCAHKADQPALRLNDDVLTWQQLCARIDSLAAGFRHQGVEDGEGVMLLACNHPQTLLAWLALLQCGARILPVNPQLPGPLLDVLLPQMTLNHALVLDGAYDGIALVSLSEMPGEYAVPWQPERLASMTLTSGSTGLPKAAVHTCAAHLASAEGVLALMPYGDDDDWLLSLPLFHVSGQGILWRWLQAGARLTVREKQPLEQALQGCSHASLVPTQLWRLLNAQHQVALKAVLLGGAAISVELTEKAREQGIRTFCGYGLTEFASTVCAKAADGEPDVGAPLPGREVQVVDGEVWIRAQSMAAGYWRDGALLSLTNAQGWFATRDRGEWQNGRLTILGRMDNLFFSGGEGVQPEAVERIIVTHPQISQVFIVPLDDAEFGQRPVAVVECEPGTDIARFPDWIRGRVARFEQPVHWLALPAELKNGGIKISRQALKQWVNALLRG